MDKNKQKEKPTSHSYLAYLHACLEKVPHTPFHGHVHISYVIQSFLCMHVCLAYLPNIATGDALFLLLG